MHSWYSWSEWQGQSSLLHKQGTVEFNTTYVTRRKPVWLIALKLLGVAAMVAVGYGLLVPALMQIQLALWQAAALATGVMMLYMGIAFFVRPEPNTDNMGWGIGGMADDPFQYSDDVNRSLWSAQCLLGPGRFTAETFLDMCALLGLAHESEVIDEVTEEAAEVTSYAFPDSQLNPAAYDAAQRLPEEPAIPRAGEMSPNRFERPRARQYPPEA
jgi:hypothetical protein